MPAREEWLYRLPTPTDGTQRPVETATCPYCPAQVHRTISSLSLDAGPGAVVNWRILHDQPLCFEWETGRVSAAEVLEAFTNG